MFFKNMTDIFPPSIPESEENLLYHSTFLNDRELTFLVTLVEKEIVQFKITDYLTIDNHLRGSIYHLRDWYYIFGTPRWKYRLSDNHQQQLSKKSELTKQVIIALMKEKGYEPSNLTPSSSGMVLAFALSPLVIWENSQITWSNKLTTWLRHQCTVLWIL